MVVVTDVNEMPTSIHMQGGTVAENQAAGQLVAQFTTDDPDNDIEDRQVRARGDHGTGLDDDFLTRLSSTRWKTCQSTFLSISWAAT